MEDYRILANSAYEANNALILKLKKNKTKKPDITGKENYRPSRTWNTKFLTKFCKSIPIIYKRIICHNEV